MTKELETKHKEIKDRIEEKLLSLPNVPHSSVPKGKTPEENEVFKAWDKSFPSLHADALPHWELAEKYDLFSLSLGVQLTGSGFPVYKGKGAKLQRALISFFWMKPPMQVFRKSFHPACQPPQRQRVQASCQIKRDRCTIAKKMIFFTLYQPQKYP